MRVLVTGGAGFIGSHIVDALVGSGAETIVVDDLSTGFERNLNKDVTFYKMSICDPDLKLVFERERPEAVCHQAAHTVVTGSVSDPAMDARTNILGSLNVISNCIEFGITRLAYASSCAAYGKVRYLPVDEEHPVDPISPYGVSKHTVEHYLHLSGLVHGLSSISLRYSNIYGPRQNPLAEAGVIAIFAGRMLKGLKPTIFGPGNKTRDYVYVKDVVAANLLALENSASGVFNIATGIETTDQKVYEVVRKYCKYKGDVEYAPVRKGEIDRIYLKTSKAVQDLGWMPEVDFDEGAFRTVEYYRKNNI